MSKSNKVLIVEDTSSIALVFQSWLGKAGIGADIVGDGNSAVEAVRSGDYQLLLLDLQLPDISGLEVLEIINKENLGVSVVVITASGSINLAVQTMQKGAYDFIVKPASEERVVITSKNALEREFIQKTIENIRAEHSTDKNLGFIGSSLPMIALYKTIKSVARSNASVFIAGESGTGKELCAAAIHASSARAEGQFVALNCASIPKDLLESEVFGHAKGAFTGATTDRVGAASTANRGTLFLDEICELDLNLQAKLLRFLQTGTVQKVGSDKAERVDVRVVCATNRNPVIEVEEGRFREDLFYRLHVIPVELPPLREREGDVVEIAVNYLEQANAEEDKNFQGFTSDAEDILLSYDWPGNVRELQNVIRNAVVLNDTKTISGEMLSISAASGPKFVRGPTSTHRLKEGVIEVSLDQPFASIERQIIEESITRNGNSIPKCSEVLKLSPSTIYRKREGWIEEGEAPDVVD